MNESSALSLGGHAVIFFLWTQEISLVQRRKYPACRGPQAQPPVLTFGRSPQKNIFDGHKSMPAINRYFFWKGEWRLEEAIFIFYFVAVFLSA